MVAYKSADVLYVQTASPDTTEPKAWLQVKGAILGWCEETREVICWDDERFEITGIKPFTGETRSIFTLDALERSIRKRK